MIIKSRQNSGRQHSNENEEETIGGGARIDGTFINQRVKNSSLALCWTREVIYVKRKFAADRQTNYRKNKLKLSCRTKINDMTLFVIYI